MTFKIELEQESDGRWIAEIAALPGVLAYGTTPTDAIAKVQALALRVGAASMRTATKPEAADRICITANTAPALPTEK